MMALRNIATVTLALAATVSALPTTTIRDTATRTVHPTGVTHSVVAGLGGLHFDPANVVAEIGDIIEWHFLPANHSIVQSSFDEPCKPLDGGNGFGPGFQFATAQGQATNVFQLLIEDKSTIWYYCPQTKGNHCQAGMAGVINQNFDNNEKTLDKYKAAAALTGVSVIPPPLSKGNVIVNPFPDRGF